MDAESSQEELLSFVQAMASYARDHNGLIPPDDDIVDECLCNPSQIKCLNQSLQGKVLLSYTLKNKLFLVYLEFCSTVVYNETVCKQREEIRGLEVSN